MPYAKGFSPHIRSSASVPQIFWQMILALLPVLAVSIFFKGWLVLRTASVSMATAILSEWVMATLFKKKAAFENGTSVLTGLLLSLTLPYDLSSGMVMLGSFFSVGVAKEMFGGMGANPFHPAVAGHVFLHVCFPHFIGSPLVDLGWPAILALGFGGLVLMGQRIIFWEIPLIYGTALGLFSFVFGFDPWAILFSGSCFLSAFFLITDPATTPLTRNGVRFFAFGGAALGALLRSGSYDPGGIYFPILLMNAASPWLDVWFKPALLRKMKY